MISPHRGFSRAVSFGLLVSFICTSAVPAFALRQEPPAQNKTGLEELKKELGDVAHAAGIPLPDPSVRPEPVEGLIGHSGDYLPSGPPLPPAVPVPPDQVLETSSDATREYAYRTAGVEEDVLLGAPDAGQEPSDVSALIRQELFYPGPDGQKEIPFRLIRHRWFTHPLHSEMPLEAVANYVRALLPPDQTRTAGPVRAMLSRGQSIHAETHPFATPGDAKTLIEQVQAYAARKNLLADPQNLSDDLVQVVRTQLDRSERAGGALEMAIASVLKGIRAHQADPEIQQTLLKQYPPAAGLEEKGADLIIPGAGPVVSVAYNHEPSNKTVVAADANGGIFYLDRESGHRRVDKRIQHTGDALVARFSAAGSAILVVGRSFAASYSAPYGSLVSQRRLEFDRPLQISAEGFYPGRIALSPGRTSMLVVEDGASSAVIRNLDPERKDAPAGAPRQVMAELKPDHGVPTSAAYRWITPTPLANRDGHLAAVGTSAGTIELWDTRNVADGELNRFMALTGHPKAVISLAFDQKRKRTARKLASGDTVGQVRIWDVYAPAQPRVVQHVSQERVQALAFSPSEDLLASTGQSGTIYFWNSETGDLRGTIEGGNPIFSMEFSPDGKKITAGFKTGRGRIWSVPAAGLEQSWTSPDGRFVVEAVTNPNTHVGGTILQLSSPGGVVKVPQDHFYGRIVQAAFSQDSQRVFAWSGQPAAKVKGWDLSGLGSAAGIKRLLDKGLSKGQSVDISRDGQIVYLDGQPDRGKIRRQWLNADDGNHLRYETITTAGLEESFSLSVNGEKVNPPHAQIVLMIERAQAVIRQWGGNLIARDQVQAAAAVNPMLRLGTEWLPVPGHPDQVRVVSRLGPFLMPQTLLKSPELLARVQEEVRDMRDRLKPQRILHFGMGGSAEAGQALQGSGLLQEVPAFVFDTSDPHAVSESMPNEPDAMAEFLRTSKINIMSMGMTSEEPLIWLAWLDSVARDLGIPSLEEQISLLTLEGSSVHDYAKKMGLERLRRNLQPDDQEESAGRMSGPVTTRFPLWFLGLNGYDLKEAVRRQADLSTEDKDRFAALGETIAQFAEQGKNKVTWVLPKELAFIGPFLKQGWEESLGLKGKAGLTDQDPQYRIKIVIDEPLHPAFYANAEESDRVFLMLEAHNARLSGAQKKTLNWLQQAGHPVLSLSTQRNWQNAVLTLMQGNHFAVAAVGKRWNRQFVNQPGVENYKARAKRMIIAAMVKGGFLKPGEVGPNGTVAADKFFPALAQWVLREDEAHGSIFDTDEYRAIFNPNKTYRFAEGQIQLVFGGAEGSFVPMGDAADILRQLIKLTAPNRLNVGRIQHRPTPEILHFGDTRFTEDGRQLWDHLQQAATGLFREPFKINVDVSEGPRTLHEYHEAHVNEPQGISIILIPEDHGKPPRGHLSNHYIWAQALASFEALERAGRTVVLVRYPRNDASGRQTLLDFFHKVSQDLPQAAGVEEMETETSALPVYRIIRPNYNGPVNITGKVGGTDFELEVGSAEGLLNGIRGVKEPTLLQPGVETKDQILERWALLMSGLIRRVGVNRVMKVELSAPGAFKPDGTLLWDQANIPGLEKGLHMAHELQRHLARILADRRAPALGDVIVEVGHDATQNAEGERSRFGKFPNAPKLFFIGIGTGVATRAVFDGVPFTGGEDVQFMANEVPHFLIWNPATGSYDLQILEHRGIHRGKEDLREDMEDRTSGPGIGRALVAAIREALRPKTFRAADATDPERLPEAARILERLQVENYREVVRKITKDPSQLTADEFSIVTKVAGRLAAERGNPNLLAKEVFVERARELGSGLATTLVEFSQIRSWMEEFQPEGMPMVVGGGVSQVGSFYLDAVKEGFARRYQRYQQMPGVKPIPTLSADQIYASDLSVDSDREKLAGLPSAQEVSDYAQRLAAIPPPAPPVLTPSAGPEWTEERVVDRWPEGSATSAGLEERKFIFTPVNAELALALPAGMENFRVRIVTAGLEDRLLLLERRPDLAGAFIQADETGGVEAAVAEARRQLGAGAQVVTVVLDRNNPRILLRRVQAWLVPLGLAATGLEEEVLQAVYAGSQA